MLIYYKQCEYIELMHLKFIDIIFFQLHYFKYHKNYILSFIKDINKVFQKPTQNNIF